MIATLRFNLPEEGTEYEMASSANKYYCALSDIEDFLRRLDKYGDDGFKFNIENVRKKFYDILAENEVNL